MFLFIALTGFFLEGSNGKMNSLVEQRGGYTDILIAFRAESF